MSDFMIETMLKNPMFFQIFRIKLWDFSIEIKAKDADGETVEGQGDFS